MTPEIMRQYLAAHAPELEVVELPVARNEYGKVLRREYIRELILK